MTVSKIFLTSISWLDGAASDYMLSKLNASSARFISPIISTNIPMEIINKGINPITIKCRAKKLIEVKINITILT